MRLIESELREVSIEEYSSALGAQEIMLNLTFNENLKASIALSKEKVFVEMLGPERKFFIGRAENVDFEKKTKEHAEALKKAFKTEGKTPFL